MERRRLLWDNYIEWLKLLTCQFYAPLDSDNGLTDLISGQTGSAMYNNTAVWDSNENAYLMTKDASTYPYGQSIVRWSGLNMQYDITNIGYTILYEIKVVKLPINNNNTRGPYITPLVLGGRTVAINIDNLGIQIGTWYKVAAVFPKYDGASRYSRNYCNGVETYNYNRGTTKYAGNANTNLYMDINRMVDSYTKVGTDSQFYMRNAYAFTDALDIDTIKKIQNIE